MTVTRSALLQLALALSASNAWSASTATWSDTPAELARGRGDGVAVSDTGEMFLAPMLSRIDRPALTGGPAHVWSIVSMGRGTLALGTGPEGHILRVNPDGKHSIWFTIDEPMVTALAVAPDGSLIAAGSPGGQLYRIGADGEGEPWAETGERYVWSLVVDESGTVFAGTGARGVVVRVDADGQMRELFDSDEEHIVSLIRSDDSLLAGGAGRGLVYRIDADGHAMVLHDDSLAEVVALASEPDGAIIAAVLDVHDGERKRPALELRLPGGVQVGAATEVMATIEEVSGTHCPPPP